MKRGTNQKMNIIKYLKIKTHCPICNSNFIKNGSGEIFCETCGLLVLDNYPVTSTGIDNALKLAKLQKHKPVKQDLKYVGTFNGKRRYI